MKIVSKDLYKKASPVYHAKNPCKILGKKHWFNRQQPLKIVRIESQYFAYCNACKTLWLIPETKDSHLEFDTMSDLELDEKEKLNGPPSKISSHYNVPLIGVKTEDFLNLPQYASPRNEFALQDATYETILTLDEKGEGVNLTNIWVCIQKRFPNAKIEDLREKLEILKKDFAIEEFGENKFRCL